MVTALNRGTPRDGLRDTGRTFTLEFPFGRVQVRSFEVQLAANVTAVLLDVPEYFDRDGLYGTAAGDYPDNARRFATLSLGALTDAQAAGFVPEVVHAHDWQTGLAPFAVKRAYAKVFPHARSVFTIHNLAYQGGFAKSVVPELGIPWADFTPGGVEFWDHLSFMKTGLVFADSVTTVSPTYAKEIATDAGGMGLDGVVRGLRGGVTGIVNGIDTTVWNPATDVLLPAQFSHDDLSGRGVCRTALLHEAGLAAPAEGMPLFGVIGRMVAQKGADLLHAALPVFLERGAAVVVLGSGAPALEAGWRALKQRFPTRVSVRFGYDEPFAHLIEGGSDFFLMPSRFEPCGLNQLYSQRYGSVPLVHAVGGLVDTVEDVRSSTGTGITFRGATADAVQGALRRALELFGNTDAYRAVQRRGLMRDFSWDSSASQYEALYEAVRR